MRADEKAPEQEKTDLEMFFRVKLPEIWRKHGTLISMVLLLIALAIFLWSYRQRQSVQIDSVSRQNSAIGWSAVRELRSLSQLAVIDPQLARADSNRHGMR